MDDLELLRTYARTGSDEAFRELVHRHAGLVYSAARRQVGDAHAADIAQEAFLKLARQAGRIPTGTPLGPWLYAVARNAAVDFIRREQARRRREETAAELGAMTDQASLWSLVGPSLDDALARMTDADRRALLLRFFEGRKLAEVGAALGVSEDGAQKRVARGLDRLGTLLSARGIKAGSAALAADLAAHALETAPAGFAERVSAGVLSIVQGGSGAAALKAGGAFVARRWLAIGAMSAGLGAAVWQGLILLRQAAAVDAAGKTVAGLRDEGLQVAESVRRAERDAAGTRASAQAAATSGDPAADRRWSRLLDWVRDQKHQFETQPNQSTPELAYLTAADWIELASEHAQDAPAADDTKVLEDIRARAKNRFAPLLMKALDGYLAKSGGRLPAAARDLGPFFQPPVNPVLLEKYEVTKPGEMVPPGDYTTLLQENPEAEISAGDNVVSLYRTGWGMGGPRAARFQGPAELALKESAKAYAVGHAGENPKDMNALAPYIRDPGVVSALAEISRLQATNERLQDASGMASQAYQALHFGAYPPNQAAVLPYFSDPKQAADYRELISHYTNP